MVFGLLFVVLVTSSAGICEQAPTDKKSYTEEQYRHALQVCNQDVRLYRDYASFLIDRKQFEKALVWSGKGLHLAPTDPDLLVTKGAALLFLGRAKEASATLAAAPETAASSLYLGLAQRSLKDHAAARNSFRVARQLGNQDPYVLYALVQEDYALADKVAGLQDFKLMLEKYPDSPWVHELLGDAYFSQDKNEDARAEYLKAISLQRDLLDVNFRLGYIAFQSGKMDAAASYFRNEIVLNPNYVDAHLFLAETLLQTDRKEDAVVQLQTALRLDGGSELIYRRLAAALAETNRLPEAAATLQKAEQRFPKDPGFPAELSRVLKSLNRTKEAESAAERARQLIAEQHRKQEIAPIQ